jgi:two-component sensor histidine kinase
MLPTPVRYSATAGLVLLAFLARRLVDPYVPHGYPFAHFFIAILLSAALFDGRAGLFATGLAALFGDWFYLPPEGHLTVTGGKDLLVLLAFIAVGCGLSAMVGALHKALDRLQQTITKLDRAERARSLLLREFRHRTRNDLHSLAGLLMLRARTASSEAAREGLREAAGHALALARVHTRLTPPTADQEAAVVDSHDFIVGLCGDIRAGLAGEGLRPVTLLAEAEAHPLDAERAVPLGLVLNEAVTNALKYAFPEGRSGRVRVCFGREGANFVLCVVDDGVGLAEDPASRGSGLGTRLLQALAAHLRGTFMRHPGADGIGTVAELRFPAAAPGEEGRAE